MWDANDNVTFGDSIGSGEETVYTNTDVTVNSISFSNTQGGSYVLSGQGTVNLASATEPNLPPTGISVTAGSHEFQAEFALQDDAVVDIAAGATLEFVNDLILNGNTLTKTGGGELIISNTLNERGGIINGLAGIISGSGTIGGGVINTDGTLSPGTSSSGGGTQGVPEPSALVLLTLGILLSVYCRRAAR